MRVLLDENLPVELASLLAAHDVQTVSGLGWEGIKNGALLAQMRDRFDALVTMDKNLPHQQILGAQLRRCACWGTLESDGSPAAIGR